MFIFLPRGERGINEEILLIHRKTGSHGLPAGHVEEGEKLQEAAARELREEVGLDTLPDNMKFTHVGYFINQKKPGVGFFFQPESWAGEPRNMEPDEHTGVDWYPMTNLPETLAPHTRACLQNITEGKVITEYRS